MPELELFENLNFVDPDCPAYVQTGRRDGYQRIYSAHWHGQLEMHYIVSGAADVYLAQECLSVRAGDLVVVNSNRLHSAYCTQPPYESRVVILEVVDFSAELAKKNLVFTQLVRDDPVVADYFSRLSREMTGDDVGCKSMCRGILTELLVYLSRNYVEEALPEGRTAAQKRNLERLNAVLSYIERNYHQPITVPQLAQIACLSEDRFGHLFREGVGQSPMKYINAIRLSKAMGLLKTGEHSVTDVAAAVGFQDYNHFGRLFRKHYGCTPSQIKRAKNSGNI